MAQSQEEYRPRYEGLVNRFETAKERLEEITNQRKLAEAGKDGIKAFIKSLGEQRDLISEFDVRLWHTLIDKVTVHGEDDIRFIFKDGTVIKG